MKTVSPSSSLWLSFELKFLRKPFLAVEIQANTEDWNRSFWFWLIYQVNIEWMEVRRKEGNEELSKTLPNERR